MWENKIEGKIYACGGKDKDGNSAGDGRIRVSNKDGWMGGESAVMILSERMLTFFECVILSCIILFPKALHTFVYNHSLSFSYNAYNGQ